jgi:His/Glu/Gln/Arg/opine family amino acid ABC transporter permease subunit
MSFDRAAVWESLPIVGAGLWLTILLVVVSLAIAVAIGLLACAGTLLGHGALFRASRAYVGLFRALPETVVVFWLYYCGPLILTVKLTAFQSATAALAIPAGAALAEVFRAGVQAVPRGHVEAARAIGLSPFWVVWDVIAPQALRIMIPAFLGLVTILIKNTALVSAIGVEELFYRATVHAGQTFRHFELLTTVAIIYFLLIMPLSVLTQRQERRLLEKSW